MTVRYKTEHLTDELLLQHADREITSRRAVEVDTHLNECETCRKRKNQLEATLTEFVSLQNESLDTESPASIDFRSTFKSRLSQQAMSKGKRAWVIPRVLDRFAFATMAIAVVAVGVWVVDKQDIHQTISHFIPQHDVALPIPRLTPGATQSVTLSSLCELKEDPTPAVDDAIARKVFQEYRLPISSRSAYELDFLVTPELGGSQDVRNLWPEPYYSTWNARVKDQLEDYLHEAVCTGALPLSTAQKEISGDWIAAYKKYFQTDRPLANAGELSSPSNFREVSQLRYFPKPFE
jgi:hypothetical protein